MNPLSGAFHFILEQCEGLFNATLNLPFYHIVFEMILFVGIIWLLFKRSYKPVEQRLLSTRVKEELLAEWKPEPLVPTDWEMPVNIAKVFNRHIVGRLGKYIRYEHTAGREYLNMASLNFLNIIGDEGIESKAIETLHKYGVGSCGPRGFYGTMDVHLDLEEAIAKFMGCEEAVVYSYGFSTVASAIPSYAKRTDVIFADEGISFPAQKGVEASRSKVKWFRHNDTAHLESLLIEQENENRKNPKRAKLLRQFIVVEGIYINSGELCPLPELVRLKYRYKVRIFVDETISFGVLGKTGRGITEHLNVPVDDIDLITGSLETSLASCGGFCVGTKYVVSHQRLSGQGYCFSASLPPLLAAAAHEALKLIDKKSAEDNPDSSLNGISQSSRGLPTLLQHVASEVHEALIEKDVAEYWTVEGDEISPIKHLRLKKNNSLERLEEACDIIQEEGNIVLTVARYLVEKEHKCPEASIRLAVNVDLSRDEIIQLREALVHTAKRI